MKKSFTEIEFGQLKNLTILHRRNEISDSQYEEEVAWILKGRDFPILTQCPENEKIKKHYTESLNRIKEEKDIDTLTTCNERSKRNRKSFIRKQKKSRDESITLKTLAKELEEDTRENQSSYLNHPTVGSSANNNPALSESISTSLISEIISSKQTRNSLFSKFNIAMFSTVFLLLSMAFVNFGWTKDKILDSDISEKILKISTKNKSIESFFGPSAVESCNTRCIEKKGNKSSSRCASICRKLSFITYPRRLSLFNNSPKNLASRITKSCQDFNVKTATNNSNNDTVNLFTSNNLGIKDLISNYDQSLSSESEKKYSKQELCLGSNRILATIAEKVASNYNDHYAQSYYRKLKESLN